MQEEDIYKRQGNYFSFIAFHLTWRTRIRKQYIYACSHELEGEANFGWYYRIQAGISTGVVDNAWGLIIANS